MTKMSKSDYIVIFDTSTGEFDIYEDASCLAEDLGVSQRTVKRWLSGAAIYKYGKFIGHGTLHKTKRGGRR